jgi:hypothetical protein
MIIRRRVSVLILALSTLLLMSCMFPQLLASTGMPGGGTLEIDIDYTGSWYRKTFDYSRQAENIRHFVVVMPESEADRASPGWIFTSLRPLPDEITVDEDRQEYAWTLDYVYEAPEGYFSGTFEPGTYAVAVAFIASPLSREEAGVGEDVILWPGVTGGGASTDYETVVIEDGTMTSLTIEITDDHGWACPWLYVFDGQSFQRRTEILRNLDDSALARTEITPIGPVVAVDGSIVIRVAEEKDEIAYIDMLALLVDGAAVAAAGADQGAASQVSAADGEYLVLRQGETVDLHFRVPAFFTDGDPVSVVVTGYYQPLK